MVFFQSSLAAGLWCARGLDVATAQMSAPRPQFKWHDMVDILTIDILTIDILTMVFGSITF